MKRRYLTKQSLFIGMFICIVLGKIVRHTVMHNTLVVPGIGWHLVDTVNDRTAQFGITFSGIEINEAISNATLNACYIFSKLNFLQIASSYYEYEILITIVFDILLYILFYKLKNIYSLKEVLFIFSSVAVLNIFDFCLAKEPVQMLYFVLMYYILKSKLRDNTKLIFIFVVYLLCAVTYRNYYMIMAIFLLYFYLSFRLILVKAKKVKIWQMTLLVLGIFVFHLVFMSLVQKLMPSNYSELIRVRFRGESGASSILTLFNSTQSFLFSLDYLLVAVRMLIPIELLLNGPKYAIFAIYQIAITLMIIKNLRNYNNLSNTRRLALIVYLAFWMGSATFEPDFGSWVRHEAVLFPIYLIMSGYNIKGGS